MADKRLLLSTPRFLDAVLLWKIIIEFTGSEGLLDAEECAKDTRNFFRLKELSLRIFPDPDKCVRFSI